MTRPLGPEALRDAVGQYDGSSKNKSYHFEGLPNPFDVLAGFVTKAPLGHMSHALIGDSINNSAGQSRNPSTWLQRWHYQFVAMMADYAPHVYQRHARFDNDANCLTTETGSKFFQEWRVTTPDNTNGQGGVECIVASGGAGRWVRHRLRPWHYFEDLDFGFVANPTTWTPGVAVRLTQLSLADTVSDLDIWATMNVDKTVNLRWYQSDGVTQKQVNFAALTTPADGTPMGIRFKVDVDNGAGGATASMYTSPVNDEYHWTKVGADQILGAPTNFRMRAGTAWFFSAGGNGHMQGRFYSCWARAYIDGPTYLPVSLCSWETFQVTQLKGGPSLDWYEATYPGRAVDDTFDNPDWAPFLLPDANFGAVGLSSSHNDAQDRSTARYRRLERWVSNVRYRAPNAIVYAISQNPDGTSGGVPLGNRDDHHWRTVQDAKFFRSLDVPYIDTGRAFYEDPRSWDSVMQGYHHPADDGTGLTNRYDRITGVPTNPVTRQAQIVFNTFIGSSFAVTNPTQMTRA